MRKWTDDSKQTKFGKLIISFIIFRHVSRELACLCNKVMIKVHIPSFRKVDCEHERNYTVSLVHLRVVDKYRKLPICRNNNNNNE